MHFVRRSARGLLLVGAATLAACGADPIATPGAMPTLATAPASAQPAADPTAREAYSAAICPLFVTIVEVDPRVGELRQLGTSGEPVGPHRDEIAAVSDELHAVRTALAAVPDWEPGRLLVFRLRESLGAMRAQLVIAEGEPASAVAARTLAAIPLGVTPAVEQAMARAVDAGMTCGGDE